ncbi:V8-like Glu-specific endopeptidase [Roseimicrobium gellanilyticum]|uniref:Serine protease n=1 Tax=Roseimicrobium gellanilyticum TaxID=748857 RepID=A0A366HBE1_9BACT|nr:trypsin-like peptidase domain-containing protein [Roseimicrobium gellanilyticum]RBP39671.1 V8-like Glu-specific endopeptidase [Roseimicrobium gellanilyticum]
MPSTDFLRPNAPFAADQFTAESGFESFSSSGVEGVATPSVPELDPAAPADEAQVHRARDLFIRGVLTEDQMREASASVGGFEAIIGKADYLPASFLEQGVVVSRATCLISTRGTDYLGRSGAWTGTGFIIAPNVLVTNNHVLNSRATAAAAECTFNFQTTPSGQPARTKAFRLRPDALFITSSALDGLDYSFVAFEGDPAAEFGSVPIKRSAFAIAPSEYANIVSHPDGRPKLVSIKENEVKWQDELVVHYASDTEPGSSGAPVSNNNWQLVALHHASKRSQVPGFEILNEGIKFSAIAADLERRSRDGSGDAPNARKVLSLFGGTDELAGFFGVLGRASGNESNLERVVDTYQGTEQDIDVGLWNVEWLTNRYEAKAAQVAQVIFDMKLDVWCLEESSPNGVQAVVEVLKDTYGLNFEWGAAEPDSADGKQSCTMLWNASTVTGEKVEWGEPIETWLNTHSRDFDDLGLEAVHGRIFDRYPALFRFRTVQEVRPGHTLDFHVIPLHLKAMDEGSPRRRMASKIIAAAINRRIQDGIGTDYIVGGDLNAEIASEDFAALSEGGLVPISARDERDGAFTYLKQPHLSLIDHIYLSPNLGNTHGGDNFFIVAAESRYPGYIQNISDHRPIVFRMSMGGSPESASAKGSTAPVDPKRAEALAQLRKLIGSNGKS